MSEKTYFNACWLLSPRYWTGFHVVAPAKKQNGSYVNLLLNYHICGKLHSRVMLVVKSISKNLKICARSKNFLIPRSQREMGWEGGGGVFTLAVEMPLSVTGTTYQWFVSWNLQFVFFFECNLLDVSDIN